MRSRMEPRLRHLHRSGPGFTEVRCSACSLRFLGMLSMLSRTWNCLAAPCFFSSRLILRIRFREGCFQTANDRRLHRRGCDLTNSPMSLSF